ncbi:site-specific DNA-methyltransferase [bacterium]
MTNLDKKLMNTPDLNKERLEKLKQLFPDLFTIEGKLNPDELKKIIDSELIKDTERFEFKWFGKTGAKRTAFTPSKATLIYDEGKSVNPENADGNMIIEGENLETLKCLLSAYRERVKCIYIDPPYNTGKDFVYSDKWNEEKETYWEHIGVTQNGVKVDTNTDSSGRYHSNWLNMMYSRLLLARQLLKDDGVIFISIDDNEVHHLRKLCDEIFGEENFVGQIIWQTATDNNPTQIATEHEYVICYVKNKDEQDTWEISSEKGKIIQKKYEELKDIYGNNIEEIQNDLRKWIRKQTNGDDLSGVSHYSYVDEQGVFYPGNSANTKPGGYDYDIIHPIRKKVCAKPDYGYRFTKATFEKANNRGDVFWGENENTIPKIKKRLDTVMQKLKSYYYEDNRATTAQLINLMGDKVFNNPKSVNFLKHAFRFVVSEKDIVLDFFAGSGTTAHVAMKLNREDGGNRKFILVQMPELTDEKSEAYKVGYKKISDITIERNKRVIEKIEKEENTKEPSLLPEDNKPFKTGFKVYKLTKSNFPRVDFTPDTEKTEEENIELLKKYIEEKEAMFLQMADVKDIFDEVLLKNGFMLNYKLDQLKDFSKNEIYQVKDNYKEALICMDMSIEKETLEDLKKYKDKLFICLERSLDTTMKWNFPTLTLFFKGSSTNMALSLFHGHYIFFII